MSALALDASVVCIGKHLCGAATDFGLRCAVESLQVIIQPYRLLLIPGRVSPTLGARHRRFHSVVPVVSGAFLQLFRLVVHQGTDIKHLSTAAAPRTADRK